jgi:hypothetical protein
MQLQRESEHHATERSSHAIYGLIIIASTLVADPVSAGRRQAVA